MKRPETHKCSKRPGFLKQYAEHAGLAVAPAARALRRIGIDYTQPFDFQEADRLRAEARSAYRSPASRKRKSEPGDRILSLAEEQRKKEHFRARLMQLQFRRLKGELVSVRDVERDVFAAFRQCRDSLLGIPDRIAGIVAAESDQHRVHQLIAQEIREVLNGLQERIKFHEEASHQK
jgi:hypothetical protein